MRSTRRPAALVATVAVLIVGGMLAGGVTPALASLTAAASPTPSATPAPSGSATSGTADKKKIPKESWAAVPVQPRNTIALRSSFFLEGQPGATIYDAMQISNFTGAKLPLDIYGSDAGNIPNGGTYSVRPITDKMTDVGTWVTPQKRKIVAPKDKGVKVPFKVTIPRTAAPGDHIGGIVTVGLAPKNTTGGSKVLIQRAIATRLYIRVSGFNTNAVVVDKVTLKGQAATLPKFGSKGSANVTYTYRNAGTLNIRPTARVTLTGLFGRTLHESKLVTLPETYPGQSVTLSEQFVGMPAFDRVDARVEIVDEGTPARQVAGATGAGDDVRWVVSWVLVALVAVVIALVSFLFIRRDRRRSRGSGPDPQPVAAMGVPAPWSFGGSGAAAPDATPPAADQGGRRSKPSEGGRRRRGTGGAD